MPKKFIFIAPSVKFSCVLENRVCTALTKNKSGCKNKVVIGQPFCWVHLLSHKHLRIKPSLIPNAGNGLFAVDKTKTANAVIFKKGEKIIDYIGERLDRNELDERYKEFTAPYTLTVKKTPPEEYIDSACYRGAGALANHSSKPNAQLKSYYNHSARKMTGYLRAEKNIKNNTEILVDYGDEYFLDEENVHHTTK